VKIRLKVICNATTLDTPKWKDIRTQVRISRSYTKDCAFQMSTILGGRDEEVI